MLPKRLIYSFTLILITALTLLLFYASTINAAEVKNIKPSQVGNRILFEFDVDGSAGEEADVSITLTINGKAYSSDNLRKGKGREGQEDILERASGLSERAEFSI